MSVIDWSKAPEGATHYMPESDVWTCGFWKKEDGGNYFHGGDEWRLTFAEPFHNPRLISRPTDQPWTGAGLPPVGAVVECTFAAERQSIWHRGTVVYRGTQPEGDEFVVVKTENASACYRSGNPVMIRPYRTPEQIAAELREKEIDAVMEDLSLSPECRYIAKRVVVAGYRKQEQPK